MKIWILSFLGKWKKILHFKFILMQNLDFGFAKYTKPHLWCQTELALPFLTKRDLSVAMQSSKEPPPAPGDFPNEMQMRQRRKIEQYDALAGASDGLKETVAKCKCRNYCGRAETNAPTRWIVIIVAVISTKHERRYLERSGGWNRREIAVTFSCLCNVNARAKFSHEGVIDQWKRFGFSVLQLISTPYKNIDNCFIVATNFSCSKTCLLFQLWISQRLVACQVLVYLKFYIGVVSTSIPTVTSCKIILGTFIQFFYENSALINNIQNDF